MATPLNALLLLSASQPPHPRKELRWHAEYCKKNRGPSAMATTRVITGLEPGRSVVAFYGDASLDNRLLGYAGFAGYERIGSAAGDRLLQRHELYGEGNHPPGLKGVILLDAVRVVEEGADVDALAGIIRANGLPLTKANLPAGPSRILIYYHSRGAA